MSSFRRSVELKAGPALVVLGRGPRWVPFVVVLGCLVGGLLLTGPVGIALLAVVAVLLGLLLFFAWPALLPPQRLLRAAAIAVLVLVIVSRF